ncbi:AsmA family protein [Sulfurospirillum arcachonense]|uniref:AsmA family protein n=1 Tax=Sulfurospirillum arcachonense TaxID=57666 RepID=UPI000469A513|nr:AsmA family protein [Sulfurospirillum arcachonense]
MKKLMISTVVLLGLIIVGLVVAIAMIDLNQYKPKIEQAVKDASGYDLKINGDISTSFSPIGVSVTDVSVAVPKKKAFVSFKSFDVALELIPLLKQKVKVNYIVLSNLDLMIEKMKNGKFNFDIASKKETVSKTTKKPVSTTQKEPTKLPLVNVTEVRLENANVTYIDNISNAKANANNIDVTINDISLDSTKEKLKSIAFKGNVSIEKIQYNKYTITNTTLDFDLKDAIANLNSMKYTIFGSLASAKARVDMSGKTPKVSFEELIPELKLENFSKEVLEKDLLKGIVNSTAKLSFVGNDELSARKTLVGHVLLDGKKVGIKGYDLDKIVKSYNDLKSGDLKKSGASFLSSALENTAKGKSAFDSLQGGTTAIEQLHVKIDVSKKMANLSDVAIATLNNRVALQGSINLVDESLKGVKVAILDKQGCAKYTQGIEGTLSAPTGKGTTSSKVSVEQVQEVIGMVSSFFGKSKKKAAAKTTDEKCKVFYNGVVKQP